MRRLPWCGVLVLAAALTPAAWQNPVLPSGIGTAQPTAPPDRGDAAAPETARIRGRVVRADAGVPLRGAQILLEGIGPPLFVRRATADDQGRYEFAELPSGRYYLQAEQSGYITLSYGQRRSFEPGRPISLADAQVLSEMNFALPRGGVITGRVSDEFGEPVTGAEMRVERYRYGPGGRQLATFTLGAALPGPIAMMTNDRGEFRVFGLTPGEYVVSARFRQTGTEALTLGAGGGNDVAETFIPTYYPGTMNIAEAQTINVGISQEVAAHFTMVPGRMVRISGTVVTSTGLPAMGMTVRLRTETATSSAAANAGSVAPDGSFSVGHVAPGEYVLVVQPQPAGRGAEVASLPIAVGTDDLIGLHIATRPGTMIRGRLEWEGSAPRPTATLRVNQTSVVWPRLGPTGESTFTYLDTARGTLNEDDTFELDGIIGVVSFRVLGLTPPWTVKAVIADGVDITDTGADAASLGGDTRVRIVLTDTVTNLSGSARNTRGEPVIDYVLVLLPAQAMDGGSGIRFTRTVRPDQDGSFSVRGLPPGRYVAAAVDGLEQGTEWNPEFQETVRASGRSFTLTEGQTLTLSLELMP